MKKILIAVAVAFLAIFQTVVLPVNLALLIILLNISGQKESFVAILILVGSFFLSVFGNLSFGLTLIGFSVAVLGYLLLNRILPDRPLFKIGSLIVILAIWELLIVNMNYVYKSLI